MLLKILPLFLILIFTQASVFVNLKTYPFTFSGFIVYRIKNTNIIYQIQKRLCRGSLHKIKTITNNLKTFATSHSLFQKRLYYYLTSQNRTSCSHLIWRNNGFNGGSQQKLISGVKIWCLGTPKLVLVKLYEYLPYYDFFQITFSKFCKFSENNNHKNHIILLVILIFIAKFNSLTQKTPNLSYWASKSA